MTTLPLEHPDFDLTPRNDGSNFSTFFSYDVPGDPHPQTPTNMRSRTWMLLSMYLMGPDIGHRAVYHSNMGPDAKAIRGPTLIVTDSRDGIHYMDDRLARVRPDFQYEVFSNYTGIQMMNEPKRWAKMVGDYVAKFER
jgi:hypothetical protein